MASINEIKTAKLRRIGLGLAVASWMLIGQIAKAQWNEAPPSAAERDKEYSELGADSEQLQREANVLRKVVHLIKPAVVHIDSEHSSTVNRYHREVDEEEAGSGTIIESGGKFYVLTNRHVVENAAAESIKIRLADGRELSPTHIWMDKPTDIAVLAVDAPNLVSARIGSTAGIEIGDFVIAVGSPFGLSHSVTFGIISAKGRRDLQLEGAREDVKFQNFLQTDAAINPGNSGGPLVNIKGEVIGMNTAIASSSQGSEGIGFTIPIDMAMFVANQLIEHGSVTRAYLGVKFYDPKKDKDKFNPAEFIRIGLSHPCGARIAGTTAKSPAEAAKLQPDDVIVEFNNVPVEDDSHLMCLVSLVEVGKEVPIIVFRNHQSLNLTVKVGDRASLNPSSE